MVARQTSSSLENTLNHLYLHTFGVRREQSRPRNPTLNAVPKSDLLLFLHSLTSSVGRPRDSSCMFKLHVLSYSLHLLDHFLLVVVYL